MDRHTAAPARVRASILPVSTLALLLLSGCGGGGDNLPSPTRTLPSVSVSVPTGPPSTEAPETPTPSEAPSETQEPTPSTKPTATPRPTKSVIVTQTVTPSPTETLTPPETANPTPTPTAAAAPAATDTAEGALPSWMWWLLAVVLTGLVAYLIRRARRRSAWDDEAADAELEVGWLARELLPQLQQAGTPQALAGGWQVSAARASAVEDQLTGLETSAPDEPRAARARDLRDAVRAARADVESQITSGDQASTPTALAASIARLQDLLNPSPPAA